MSYWYTQYKHAEIARTQNKREQRLLQLELESRHGIRNVHKYKMQLVEHEQRMIERELERIRKGMNKRPLQQNSIGNLGNLALFARSHVTPRRPGRHENVLVNEKYAKENLSGPGIDNVLFRAIVPGEHERVSPYECGDTIPSHLAESPRVSGVQSVETYPGLVLSQGEYQGKDISGKDSSSRTHNIDSGRKEQPTITDTLLNPVLAGVNGLDSQGQSIERRRSDRGGIARQNGVAELDSPRIKRRPQGASLDIAQLASLDMKSVKSDVSRRLSQDTKGNVSNSSRDVKQDENSEAAPVQEEPKPKEKTRRVSRSKVPAADSHKKVMDFDPEHYNPDGSLRKMHAMPSVDKTWDEARKARYIRTKETVESEKELTVEEMFGGKTGYKTCKQ